MIGAAPTITTALLFQTIRKKPIMVVDQTTSMQVLTDLLYGNNKRRRQKASFIFMRSEMFYKKQSYVVILIEDQNRPFILMSEIDMSLLDHIYHLGSNIVGAGLSTPSGDCIGDLIDDAVSLFDIHILGHSEKVIASNV